MNQPTLSIILVSYNTAEYTQRAIESVFKETVSCDFEVIVVDNNSTDNSVELLKQNFTNIQLIESKSNPGFAGGVCLGIENAQGDYLLLLNPDTLVVDGAIDKLLQFAKKKPDNGIWGGITLNDDMSLNTQHAWSRPTFTTLLFSAFGLSKAFSKSCFFNNANYGCWERDSVKEVDILSGCFFLTSRKTWEQVGGLDPQFFMYAEEADYCLRAIKYGYQPIVTPNARIVHHGGVSHSHFSGKLIKLLKGKVELINRHVSSGKRPVYKFLLYLYVLNKHMLHKFFKPNAEEASEWRTVFEQRTDWLKGYH
uniref:dTDP-Rha:A-D-GlcNAc-diphosphoryl polyprenol, A-3-L-rhamnosyl transferase WbbL n=1 Tax=uncultured Thiotrichaceae bacterium TaxID=298394 RepID=A0A6S6U2B0_9GAMM|nr:MAG: dTDP-Rha:A-D-GlcNAc-diphosphoryl polyprenol, A-3-L-rhamnosyl transferase WbbL [uncultured Thiotrichaceae bacterium]